MVVKEVILYFVRGEVIMLITLQTKLSEQVNNVPVTNDKKHYTCDSGECCGTIGQNFL